MGGIQKASSFLANSLDEFGFEVIMMSLYKSENFFFKLNKEIKYIEPNFERKSTTRFVYVFKMMNFVRKSIKKIKPDIIVAYSEWSNSFVVMATMGLKIPVFLSDRFSPDWNLGTVQTFMKRVMYKKATGIIAQTSYAKEVIFNKIKNKNIEVIPNPVSAIDAIDCPKKNQIVTVGRMAKEKGHKYLIDAFSKINNQEWQLLLVGDGPERKSLEEQTINLGLQNRVIFAGTQKELSKYLSESKIFVLPSLFEGFPNALIEAMSVPLPCISFNCTAGPSDIINDGINGLLVETANSDLLLEAIETLINNENLRNEIAKNAFKIREDLCIDVIIKKYVDFILK